MSAGGNDNRVDAAITGLEEKMDDLTLRPNFTQKSNYTSKQNSASLPYTVNGMSDADNSTLTIDDVNDEDVLEKIRQIESCPMSSKEKCNILGQLYLMIKSGRIQLLVQADNFRLLLRVLIELLEKSESKTQIIVLLILTEIFNCNELKEHYLGFLDLLIMKILHAHTLDHHKEVNI